MGIGSLSEEQMVRLEQLQKSDILLDNYGNIIESDEQIIKNQLKLKMTYFLFKGWKMPVTQYIKVLVVILVVAFFMERYCFMLMIYKNKHYGALLILLLIFFNAIFLFLI